MFASSNEAGHVLKGHTTALESGTAWSVGYVVETDQSWRTVRVRAASLSPWGGAEVVLERRDGDRWFVDGEHRPELDGCVDVDFESSSVTNTLPIHRLDLPVGQAVDVPAAFVRADDLRVERLEQTYTRLNESGRFAYTSSTFDVACELVYDAAGLIIDYPGIATRVS